MSERTESGPEKGWRHTRHDRNTPRQRGLHTGSALRSTDSTQAQCGRGGCRTAWRDGRGRKEVSPGKRLVEPKSLYLRDHLRGPLLFGVFAFSSGSHGGDTRRPCASCVEEWAGSGTTDRVVGKEGPGKPITTTEDMVSGPGWRRWSVSFGDSGHVGVLGKMQAHTARYSRFNSRDSQERCSDRVTITVAREKKLASCNNPSW